MPPRRSNPSRVGLVAITTAASASRTNTTPRIARFRRRSVKAGALLRGQHEQQAAVIVIGGKDVCLCRLGPVALRVHDHMLVQHAYAPLESGADVVVACLELQSEDLLGRA